MDKGQKHVAVCGAGPVGALCACYLANRGYKVDLYEMREDIRTLDVVRGRSINMAVSCRGREALKRIGLEEQITAHGIPMHARMIHEHGGSRRPILYGTKNQYIMSIDRRFVNEALLTAAEKHDNVQLFFSHKLKSCNFHSGEAVFHNKHGEEVRTKVDLIVGADGAYSNVRKQMMKLNRFDYQQQYIPHGYMELNIPPSKDNQFAMEVNFLHIWPRHEYMLIALPNVDRSYTTTLFMSFDKFESITCEQELLEFFQREFPDSLPLLGEKGLIKTFFSSTPQPMVSVKCHPYHVKGKAVLLGDAAHAMVPFYGQGMNCGLEDCIVLNEILDKYSDDFEKALSEYTEVRHPDAVAICDLAMYNYIEMRSKVTSRLFLLRKKLDNFLYQLFPSSWVPLYTMVSFTRTPYHQCVLHRKWQDKMLTLGLTTAAITGGLACLSTVYTLGQQGYSLSDLHLPDAATAVLSQVHKWLHF
ncbi:hypothetical protein BsWGS_09826 [Bradybaena similaris]